MSDLSAHDSPRPVSLFTVFAVFVGFSLFAVVLYYVYLPQRTGSFSDDGVNTAQQRIEKLQKLNETHLPIVTSTKYSWVDQKAGVVRLPMNRAIELTVQQYGAKK